MPSKPGKPSMKAINTGQSTKGGGAQGKPGVPSTRQLKTWMPAEINSAPRPSKPSTGGKKK